MHLSSFSAHTLSSSPLGQLLGALDATLGSKSGVTPSSHPVYGILVCLLGVLLGAYEIVYEEWLWSKFHISPVEGIGWMGMICLCVSMIFQVIAHAAGFEDMVDGFYMVGHTPTLLVGFLVFMLVIAVLNTAALLVTSIGSALFTSTVLEARSVVLWAFNLAVGYAVFSVLSLMSTLIITLGFCFYANFMHSICPTRVSDILTADLHIRCKIIYGDESVEDNDELMANSHNPSHSDIYSPQVRRLCMSFHQCSHILPMTKWHCLSVLVSCTLIIRSGRRPCEMRIEIEYS